jgi:hypothetical protein
MTQWSAIDYILAMVVPIGLVAGAVYVAFGAFL